jgi:glycoside/pentoside/hexuronide:cation symporter, GPH family
MAASNAVMRCSIAAKFMGIVGAWSIAKGAVFDSVVSCSQDTETQEDQQRRFPEPGDAAMGQATQHAVAAADRIPLSQKLIYGLGAFVNNLLAAAIGGMTIVLNLGLGMNPALVGLLGALPRLFDALTDPIMGYVSDNTRSRWGRRRPYIFIGAIAVGISYILLWQLPTDRSEMFLFWYFLIGSLFFYAAYTVFATPWVALGYELTPDYHERTRLMGVQNFIGQLAYIVAPWFLLIMQNQSLFDNMVDGAASLAVAIAVVAIGIGVLPAIFLRERFAFEPATGELRQHTFFDDMRGFFAGFALSLRVGPFVKLCMATLLIFNGFMMISAFQSYVIIYYVFAGDTVRGAEFAGYVGTAGTISTFVVIALVTWLGTHIGKRNTFFLATGLSMLGYALKWVCYDPANPWLMLIPAPLMAFGLGGLFTLMPSMICDVVDLDELQTRQRREGMFGSIYWWFVKLGLAAALAAGGFLLNATGFDVALAGEQTARTIFLMRLYDIGVPLVGSAIAMWMIATYPITEDSAREVRRALEARRGA